MLLGVRHIAQCRLAAIAVLQKTVQVATVMEHAPPHYRDLLQVVPSANHEIYVTLRAYVRE